jgi:hypothetical protein
MKLLESRAVRLILVYAVGFAAAKGLALAGPWVGLPPETMVQLQRSLDQWLQNIGNLVLAAVIGWKAEDVAEKLQIPAPQRQLPPPPVS